MKESEEEREHVRPELVLGIEYLAWQGGRLLARQNGPIGGIARRRKSSVHVVPHRSLFPRHQLRTDETA